MIVDANVLLYAADSTSTFHGPSKTWLEDALNGPHRVGFPWPSLLAFQRISTHPRASANPLDPRSAWAFVRELLNAEQSWIPTPGDRHASILERLIVDLELRANLVPDAHLAALALEHGVGVCSYDSDFARFPGVTWHRPGDQV